jgi:Flp pilus assembly protein TadD
MDEDFLPDEFVLDDAPVPPPRPGIVFAGLSDPPPVMPASPAVAPRGGRNWQPYAVGAALGAALAAAAMTMARTPQAHDVSSAVVTTAETAATAVPLPEAPAAPVVAAAPAASSAPVASAAPAASSAPVVPATSAVGTGSETAGAAEQALAEATKALEKGRASKAVEAAGRAVALDPTNAQAWLVLGGAYDELGSYTDARRSFSQCVHVATRGPRGDCAALLR